VNHEFILRISNSLSCQRGFIPVCPYFSVLGRSSSERAETPGSLTSLNAFQLTSFITPRRMPSNHILYVLLLSLDHCIPTRSSSFRHTICCSHKQEKPSRSLQTHSFLMESDTQDLPLHFKKKTNIFVRGSSVRS
jgi:hypothetical protein